VGEVWNALLGGLGTMLSFFYNLIPSYGVAIILLTITVRLLLLPLGIKQTRSMQAMQKIQPKMKELQRKYKGNRQKLNEEMMKLYKEHQVNPLGGCLPLLLQIPVFFALYRVLTDGAGTAHLPDGSALQQAIAGGAERFLGSNLACSPSRAGGGVVALVEGAPPVDCGLGVAVRILPFVLMALMVFTTWFQQRQMTRASQGSGQASQMRIMGQIMPIFLGVISWSIATGVLLYWVTTNAWQIGQQTIMLRSRVRADAPKPAGDKALGDGKKKGPPPKPAEQKPPPKPSGARNARGRKKRSKR
jgi:YidC/Oxa1 family membrane protein insertase